MKVASPASVSRLTDVSHCLNLKNRSNALPEPASAACIRTSSSFGVGGWENDRESISHAEAYERHRCDLPLRPGD